MDRDRDVNLPRTNANVEASRGDVGTEPDIRRSMIMGRGLDTTPTAREVDLPFVRNEQISPMAGDEMRWGSIWGGFLTYFVTALTLAALAVAIGALTVSPVAPGAPTAVTTGLVAGIVLVLSTLIGGMVTGWTCNLRTGWGSILNGLVYGALVVAFPVLLALLTMSIASGVAAGGAAAQEAATAGQQITRGALPTGLNLDGNTIQMLAGNVGWFSLGSLLILGSAILGTWLGMRAHLNQVRRNPIAGGIAVSDYNRHLREDMLREERGRHEVGYSRDLNR